MAAGAVWADMEIAPDEPESSTVAVVASREGKPCSRIILPVSVYLFPGAKSHIPRRACDPHRLLYLYGSPRAEVAKLADALA